MCGPLGGGPPETVVVVVLPGTVVAATWRTLVVLVLAPGAAFEAAPGPTPAPSEPALPTPSSGWVVVLASGPAATFCFFPPLEGATASAIRAATAAAIEPHRIRP